METLQIKQVGFSKKNNAEILAFHSEVEIAVRTATIEALGVPEALNNAYQLSIASLQELVKREQKSKETAEIEALDTKRDKLMVSVFSIIDTYAASPIDEMSSGAKILKEVIRNYRGMYDSAYSEETGQIRGMVNALLYQPVETAAIPYLDEMISDLGRVNSDFEKLMVERREQTVDKAESDKKRKAAQESYEQIVRYANGAVLFLPSEALNLFIKTVNQTIDDNNEAYNRRMGKKTKKEEEQPIEA